MISFEGQRMRWGFCTLRKCSTRDYLLAIRKEGVFIFHEGDGFGAGGGFIIHFSRLLPTTITQTLADYNAVIAFPSKSIQTLCWLL